MTNKNHCKGHVTNQGSIQTDDGGRNSLNFRFIILKHFVRAIEANENRDQVYFRGHK